MYNPPRIGTLYGALRQLLGDKVSSAETLHFAASLLRFCLHRRAQANGRFARFPTEEAAVPFECLPVDTAMQDGGWMVLEYEIDQLKPELQVGRVNVYEVASACMGRVYSAESEKVDAEGDRVLRGLEWLTAGKAERRSALADELGWDDYTGDDREGYDFEG